MNTSVPVTNRLFFPHVEGLRGLTALYVFLFHIRLAIIDNAAFADIVRFTPFFGYGHYAVSIFIVISGYCLGSPIAHRPDVRFDVREFAIRRFRRIYPAYFGALVISVLAFFYWSAAAYHHVPPLKNVAIAFGSHVLLVHNLIHKTALYLNGPMWSVGTEAQIYAIFGILLVPLWKRFGVVAQLVVAIVVGLTPHFLFHGKLDWTCPWYLGLFAMGVFAASLSERRGAMLGWRVAAGVIVAAAIFVVVAFPVVETDAGYGPFIWSDLLVGAALSVFLVAAADRSGRLWAPSQLLAFGPIVWLGTFAYSVYLLHWVAINVLRETLRRTNAGPAENVVAYALLIPIVLLASYGFYLVLERPFMSRFLRHVVDRPPTSIPVTSPIEESFSAG